jgi:hypothetical protein
MEYKHLKQSGPLAPAPETPEQAAAKSKLREELAASIKNADVVAILREGDSPRARKRRLRDLGSLPGLTEDK